MPQILVILVVVFGQAIFAATPIFAKVALRDFDPLSLGIVRFVISIILLNAILYARKRPLLPAKSDLKLVLWLGFLAIPANQGMFLLGLKFTSPGHSALLYSLTPLFAYILAIIFLKEKTRLLKFIGIAVAFAGVIIILTDKQIKLEPDFATGDLIIVGGVTAWAAYTVFGKTLVRRAGAFAALTYSMTAGTLMGLPFGFWHTVTFDFSQVSTAAWIGMLFIAVATSGVAYPIWYWALKYMEASRLTVFIFLQPVLANIFSYIFLHEELTRNFLIGGSTVLVGLIISEWIHPLKSTTNQSSSTATG
jgi:drug/metabolite transporter (DMT)-like permease